MHVLLFDIDGTLVNTGGAGGVSLKHAFSELFGVPEPTNVPFSGRTDRGIARDLFQAHDIDDSEEHWQLLRAGYFEKLKIHLPLHKGCVLPGVLDLLENFASANNVQLGLLTGNTQIGARMKLEHYRLFHYFSFGGFGDHHHCRNDVARDAQSEIERRFEGQVAADRVWVIGDTPLDIQCARSIGARVAAVATGTHDSAALAAEEPDLLYDDLRDAAELLERVLGNLN
jgi:phosphoglycolate phosphatase-like HAD superfamily hydrolase